MPPARVAHRSDCPRSAALGCLSRPASSFLLQQYHGGAPEVCNGFDDLKALHTAGWLRRDPRAQLRCHAKKSMSLGQQSSCPRPSPLPQGERVQIGVQGLRETLYWRIEYEIIVTLIGAYKIN